MFSGISKCNKGDQTFTVWASRLRDTHRQHNKHHLISSRFFFPRRRAFMNISYVVRFYFSPLATLQLQLDFIPRRFYVVWSLCCLFLFLSLYLSSVEHFVTLLRKCHTNKVYFKIIVSLWTDRPWSKSVLHCSKKGAFLGMLSCSLSFERHL